MKMDMDLTNEIQGKVMFPGGYATPSSSGSGYDYHYFICDYQGNVRAVVDRIGNVEEKNSYYPYGMLMPAEADGDLPAKQPYKWGGKEYMNMHGINLYDFGPRALFSPLCVFTQPDPLCESKPGISPYVYCSGNPVGRVDPSGLSDYYNLNGEYIHNIQDEINRKYIVITKSKKEDIVKKEFAAGNWFHLPSNEVLGKMKDILEKTSETNNEYMIAVGESGKSSDIIEGTENEISESDFRKAEDSLNEPILYHVHSHNKAYGYTASEIDLSNSNPGEVNFVLGFETSIQITHSYVGGSKEVINKTNYISIYQ